MGKKRELKKATCNVCGVNKPTTSEFWDDEHIVPCGFGNGFPDTRCKLFKSEYLLCKKCNGVCNWFFDEPFLKSHKSVVIRKKSNMKGRAKNIDNLKAGIRTAFIINPCTTSNHLFECLKIAFECHLKFLSKDYRDSIFSILQQLMMKSCGIYEQIIKLKYEREQHIHQDVAHAGLYQWFMQVNNDCKIVFNPEEIFSNAENITNIIKARANEKEHASLIFIFPNVVNKCVFCAVYLQSFPPVVVRISDSYDKYIADYGVAGQHILDIRTSGAWVGYEDADSSITYTTRSDYERRIKKHLAGKID